MNASSPFYPLLQPGQVIGRLEEPDELPVQRALLARRGRCRRQLSRLRSGWGDRAGGRPTRSRASSPGGSARWCSSRIGITFVAFVLTQLVPGDPAAANLGQQAINDPAAVAAFRHHYGLDKPLPEQYGLYLWHLVHGDLGQSEQNHDAVTHDLATFIPATAELAIFSMLIATVVGISLGLIAALRRNKLTDQILRVVSLGGISMPTFWLGLIALLHLLLPAELAARAPGGSTRSRSRRPRTPASTRSTR